MLDKVIISQDRRNATITFTDHRSFDVYHSGGKVVELVTELMFIPERRKQSATEDTEVIEMQLSFDLAS